MTSKQVLPLHHRAEFVAIDDHAAFVAVIADLAHDHLEYVIHSGLQVLGKVAKPPA